MLNILYLSAAICLSHLSNKFPQSLHLNYLSEFPKIIDFEQNLGSIRSEKCLTSIFYNNTLASDDISSDALIRKVIFDKRDHQPSKSPNSFANAVFSNVQLNLTFNECGWSKLRGFLGIVELNTFFTLSYDLGRELHLAFLKNNLLQIPQFDQKVVVAFRNILMENVRINQLLIISLFSFFVILTTCLFVKLGKSRFEIKRLRNRKNYVLSIIAHDLKTPLNSYQGMADAINHLIKTNQIERIQDISKQIDYMGANIMLIINNLLVWSNTQNYNSRLSKLRFPLVKEFNNVLPLYSHIAKLKGIDMIVEIHSESIVYANADSVAIIIRNLLDNAIKYCNGKGKIFIESHQTRNGVSLTFKNEMDYAFSKSAFDAVKYLNSNSKNMDETRSMGLRLIKRYAKMNNIRIEACIDNRSFLVILLFDKT